MKKLIIVICILLCGMLFAACAKTVDNDEKLLSGEELKTLLENNIYLNLEVFCADTLTVDYSQVKVIDNDFYKVVDEKFPDYGSFEDFVRSVYCKETADMYLMNYPYEGKPKYVNYEDQLYLNSLFDTAKANFTNWSEYSVEIIECTGEKCTFTVNTTKDVPGDVTLKEEYTVNGIAVFEDGKWLLQEMIK